MLAVPAISRAQTQDDRTDRQHPDEYTDQDSQLLNVIATLLWPVGTALEWGMARPLHYLATNSPVFGPGPSSQPPIAQIPTETVPPMEIIPEPEVSTPPTRKSPPAAEASAPQPREQTVAPETEEQPVAPPAVEQPVLH